MKQHEAELLKDRKELDVTGLDEEQGKRGSEEGFMKKRSDNDQQCFW